MKDSDAFAVELIVDGENILDDLPAYPTRDEAIAEILRLCDFNQHEIEHLRKHGWIRLDGLSVLYVDKAVRKPVDAPDKLWITPEKAASRARRRNPARWRLGRTPDSA